MDPRRQRHSGEYDPRVTQAMRGRKQANVNTTRELHEAFKGLCARLGVSIRDRVEALMAADVAEGGMGLEVQVADGTPFQTGVQVAQDTLEAFKGLCARLGTSVKGRLVLLMSADVTAEGLLI